MVSTRIEIIESGRSGSIHYSEGEHRLTFYWEFGGGDVVAVIIGPRAEQWAAQVPWAAGRQAEVLERVAREAVRRKLSGGSWSIDLASGVIELK